MIPTGYILTLSHSPFFPPTLSDDTQTFPSHGGFQWRDVSTLPS